MHYTQSVLEFRLYNDTQSRWQFKAFIKWIYKYKCIIHIRLHKKEPLLGLLICLTADQFVHCLSILESLWYIPGSNWMSNPLGTHLPYINSLLVQILSLIFFSSQYFSGCFYSLTRDNLNLLHQLKPVSLVEAPIWKCLNSPFEFSRSLAYRGS